MSVSVVSFSKTGGAGNVATTLVEGFSKLGLKASLVVATDGNLRSKPIEHPQITLDAGLDNFLVKKPGWRTLVSLNRDRHGVLEQIIETADLTIFRWMNGLLGKKFVKRNPEIANLVWGLDDVNPFTGVCHYSAECRGFETGCQNCPAVRKPFVDAVENNLQKKVAFANAYKPKYVAPTDWIREEFQASMLGRDRMIEKILNPLPSRYFVHRRPEPKTSSKLKLLVVASNLDDPTKGVWEVGEILSELLLRQSITLTLVGRYSYGLKSRLPGAQFLGQISRESIIEVMNRHDVLLVPSLFENAGTVVSEAASQGLPAIARRVGGMPEMTNYGDNGFLFNDSIELRSVISAVSKKELVSKGKFAKEWAQQLKPELIAAKYAEAFLN